MDLSKYLYGTPSPISHISSYFSAENWFNSSESGLFISIKKGRKIFLKLKHCHHIYLCITFSFTPINRPNDENDENSQPAKIMCTSYTTNGCFLIYKQFISTSFFVHTASQYDMIHITYDDVETYYVYV